MASIEILTSSYSKLQNSAHALDRIRQHYADNDLTDSELVTLIGNRLSEVYGPNYREPRGGSMKPASPKPKSEAVVTALYTESHGSVVSKTTCRPAERMSDGSILVRTSRGLRAATKAEAATYQVSSHV